MVSSSSSSSLKRSIDHVDMPKENISPNKKINFTPTMFQSKIINMLKDANLTIPINLLELVGQVDRNFSNPSDKDRRKELYKGLSCYLDHRNVRDRGQTYIFPIPFNDIIRQQYPRNVQNYAQIKTMKNGKLIMVKEEDKCYVQLSDFCKRI
ncbi:unnamed protein product [Rotaria socialis]|uniref:Uncharacterized protein n=1 Tax=Rotaria socialis TaxID=392032 RepID=A0A818NFE0_9BILA|nr:unnamed protein product [Rotaria socialis]CAF4655412.1 unnamed protein product [Rotaria socialis]